jgi:signal transduction histidine kinase
MPFWENRSPKSGLPQILERRRRMAMSAHLGRSWFMALMLAIAWCALANGVKDSPSGSPSKVLQVESVTVRGKSYPAAGKSRIRLGVAPQDVIIYFGFTSTAGSDPIRLCGKLEGVDEDWDRGGGFMVFMIRYYSEGGDIVGSRELKVSGNSAGWRNDLRLSALTHRRETVVVPPGAARLLVAVSSAGPQTTEGIYLVSDLQISRASTEGAVQTLLRFPGDWNSAGEPVDSAPAGWLRDGTSPRMAKMAEFGEGVPARGLAVFDDNPLGHGEWHTNLQSAPKVNPGDQLILEWNEMYSIGDSAMRFTHYPSLPPGEYRFRVREVDLFENPTGVEAVLSIIVPRPIWQNVWFWACVGSVGCAGVLMSWRYVSARQRRRETLRLERAHVLERERLRIARDIHDDLGARVTQISLVSAMAKNQTATADEMRADLEQISQMSRDLVTSLYETVWTVNPENDNLRALGNYLFQIVNDLCERRQCRCRSKIDDLPLDTAVSSSVRHHLCMVVKEAMHNVLKHADATEVGLIISFAGNLLTVCIRDNGRGFEVASDSHPGHGLANMKSRLSDLQGDCRIESALGQGTAIWCTLPVQCSSDVLL